MLAPNALSTLETLKSMLGISGTDKDALLEIMLSGASGYIEKWTGRRFKKDERTEKYNPSGDSARLYLRAVPVESVSAVNLDGQALGSGAYIQSSDAGFLSYASGLWPKGVQNASVTYTGGYVLPKDADGENERTLPYEIELAALKLAAGFYNRSTVEGASSSSSGGMSVSFADVFGEDIKALLRPYRMIHV